MATAVLFDLDNTLYPYPPCNRAGQTAALERAQELGYDLDHESFTEFYQAGRREVKLDTGGTAASHERYLYFKRAFEIHTGEPQPGDALALGDAYWSAYLEEMSLVPEAEETLEELQARGIDIAITTNLTAAIQLAKLEALGLTDDVDLVLTSEETGQEKPASVMFTLPLARLDCRASEAVMVGDDLEADIVGANAVGLETVLFDASEDSDANESADRAAAEREADHSIDTLGDLTDLVS
ncbi:HAD family hydrolase [Halopiger aswanensis]|uniref:Putative hydrolase of the HAD superfamily n=1 Tax=Halopiger aswanensis TaxID=148449 RepID=A0A3R7DCM8_9EURY|nr:HAD family hydrolase [Halopiger aswanensis]RKD98136.1 putative hydrolase of the HAD superfamily [Halopiger aswanensis]